jgi:ribosomal protein L7/L12
MATDPNLSVQLDQIYLRLQAVENQLAILSQRMGVPFSQMPPGVMDPAPAGVYYDPNEGVSYDPAAQPTASPFVGGPGGVPADLAAMVRSGKKIQAIKLYREMTNCDLATAKQFIDSL